MRSRSFFFFSLCLGMVFFVPFVCSASTPVPEKIPSSKEREVRVYLKTQTFGFYEKGKLSFSGPVCTGKKGCETPKGEFRILLKFKKKVSVEYSKKLGKTVFMPYSLQFIGTLPDGRGGHCLHQGEVKRAPSSGGCVRLNEEHAKKLYNLAQIGDTVKIE